MVRVAPTKLYDIRPDAWADRATVDAYYAATIWEDYDGYTPLLQLCYAKQVESCQSTHRGRLSRVQYSERVRYARLAEYIKYRAYREQGLIVS